MAAGVEGEGRGADAAGDLRFIRGVLERSGRVLDPHAEHFAWWGGIVLVWYPLGNLLQRADRMAAMAAVGAAALLLGGAGSYRIEARRAREGAGDAEDPDLARRVSRVVAGTLVAAGILSAVGPATGFVEGPRVPILWGLAYAQMAFTVGLLYARDFAWAGGAIFAASLAAMLLPGWEGIVLGPVMGLGMIIPARRATARVRAEREARERGAEPVARAG
jgi:hypothetical protein